MDKREKVISGLEELRVVYHSEQILHPKDFVNQHDMGLIEDALALLKAQEPRVMTAEDMWTLKFNDTVIIEQKIPPLLIPAIVRDNIKYDHCLEVLQVVTASMDGGANADYDYYGKTWRCWTSGPTDAQREKEPWNG